MAIPENWSLWNAFLIFFSKSVCKWTASSYPQLFLQCMMSFFWTQGLCKGDLSFFPDRSWLILQGTCKQKSVFEHVQWTRSENSEGTLEQDTLHTLQNALVKRKCQKRKEKAYFSAHHSCIIILYLTNHEGKLLYNGLFSYQTAQFLHIHSLCYSLKCASFTFYFHICSSTITPDLFFIATARLSLSLF